MEISVFITRESVFGSVVRRMEWEGSRTPAGQTDYDRVSISESDRTMLHSLFDEAAMHAIDIFRPFLSSAANTDEALSLKVSVPGDTEASELPMTVINMVTAHVLALWQEIVSPPRAEAFFAKRDDYAAKALTLLYHHRAPRRPIR